MKEIRNIFIGLYALIGFGFTIYGSYFGQNAYKGIAWNVGRSLVWPTIIFPSLGQAIGGLIIVALVLKFVVFDDENER